MPFYCSFQISRGPYPRLWKFSGTFTRFYISFLHNINMSFSLEMYPHWNQWIKSNTGQSTHFQYCYFTRPREAEFNSKQTLSTLCLENKAKPLPSLKPPPPHTHTEPSSNWLRGSRDIERGPPVTCFPGAHAPPSQCHCAPNPSHRPASRAVFSGLPDCILAREFPMWFLFPLNGG